MNRLHKKCLVASLGLHAFLCLILVVGPAFLSAKHRNLDLPVLEVIPDTLTDLPFSGGGNPGARQPVATPRVEAPQPQPPAARSEPVPRRAEVRPPPEPTIQRESKPDPDAIERKRDKPKPEIKVESKIVKRPSARTAEKSPTNKDKDEAESKSQARAEAEARRRVAQQLLSRINGSSERISDRLSTGTTIEPLGPGGGGPAYANYAQVVKTIYDRAWIDPEDVTDDDATVQVKVVIARDGRVVLDSIAKRSGNPSLDRSVQNALDRVRELPPFPEGAKDSQRTFIINFNLKAKRLLG